VQKASTTLAFLQICEVHSGASLPTNCVCLGECSHCVLKINLYQVVMGVFELIQYF
jgi:hypothetical protein